MPASTAYFHSPFQKAHWPTMQCKSTYNYTKRNFKSLYVFLDEVQPSSSLVGFRPVLYWYVPFHTLVRYEYTADFCLIWAPDKPGIATHINLVLCCYYLRLIPVILFFYVWQIFATKCFGILLFPAVNSKKINWKQNFQTLKTTKLIKKTSLVHTSLVLVYG